MPELNNPFVVPALIAALISFSISFLAWRRRPLSGAAPFALMMLAAGEWSFFYALELQSLDLGSKVLWAKFEYLGIVAVPLFWLSFVLVYTGRARWLSRRNLIGLALVPLLTWSLVWTNDFHRLIWRTLGLVITDGFMMLQVTYGLGFWIHASYSYVLLLLSTILLIPAFTRAWVLYRQQALVLLGGVLIPWVGNFLYLAGIGPTRSIDLTPLGFTLVGLLFGGGLLRLHLLDIVPIARDAIIEVMGDAVLVVDARDRVVDVNPAAQALLGRPRAAVFGSTFSELFSDQPELVARYLHVSEAHAEIEVGGGDGPRHFDLRISPLRGRGAQLMGRVVVLRDISARKQMERALQRLNEELEQRVSDRTAELSQSNRQLRQEIIERQHAEEALRRSEVRFRQLVENASDIITILNTDGTIRYQSPAIERLLGYTPEELIGHSAFELVHPDDVPAVADIFGREVTSPGHLAGAEFRFKSKDGSWRYFEALARNSLDDPAIGGIIVNSRDVTERIQSEQVLRRYQLLSENARDIILFMRAADGLVLEANLAAVEAYGYERAELLTKTIYDLRAAETSNSVAAQLAQAGEQGISFETFHRRKDGREFAVEVNSHGETIGGERVLLSIIRDITGRKQAQEALRESESRYREIVESASDIIFRIGLDGRFTFVNPIASRLMGFSQAELIGKHYLDLIRPDFHETARAFYVDQVKQETAKTIFDFPTIAKDGREIWIEQSVHPEIQDGKLIGFHAIARDVTERKRVEDALYLTKFCVDRASIGIVRTGPDARILSVNDQMCNNLGYSSEELCRMHIYDIDPRFPKEVWQQHRQDLRNRRSETFETFHRRKDGTTFPVQVTDSYLEFNGSGFSFSFIRDITEAKRAEMALRESEQRYALATRAANDGLWDWDLRTDLLYYSPRWKSMFGYAEDEIGNSPDEWFSRVHSDDLRRVKAEVSAHLDGMNDHLESEHRIHHKDGTFRWVQCRGLAIRDGDRVAYRMAGSLSDITARKRAEEQLFHDAFHDVLTGQPNRALFMDRLGRALEHAKRSKQGQFAVVYLDFDRFKVVNDSLGHSIGDQLLKESAQRLGLCVRSADTLARFGGDEFVILLEDIEDAQDATNVADRIQSELALPFNLNGHRVFITASAGIVVSTPEYEKPEDILRDADIGMYRAKSLGKARYEVFTPAMRDLALARLELEKDLRDAIEREEFRIYYQPIVSLSSNRIIGFEALARWQHPKRGLVLPAEFIPIAEETGLIIPIGQWILGEACRQMHEWQSRFPSEPPLQINVNLSPKQFAQSDLVAQVAEILRQTGLAAKSLGLEITEGMIVNDNEAVTVLLSQLRALGLAMHVDDFGTGYSSLSYLQYLPIDTLKIDRHFVNKLGADVNGAGIIRTIVSLAHDLGLMVVAEGVETAEQLEELERLGCEYGQGYLFAKPLKVDAASVLVAKSFGESQKVSPVISGSPQPAL